MSSSTFRWGIALGAAALVLTMGTGASLAAVEQIGPGRVDALGATSDFNGNVKHETLAARLQFADGSSIDATYLPTVDNDDNQLLSSTPGATEDDPPSVSIMNPEDWWGDSSTTGEYTPASVADTDGFLITEQAKSTCLVVADTQTTCEDIGKFTFEFSQPTEDAILHFSNLCFTGEGLAGSHAYRFNTAESEFTSDGLEFERISGTPGLVSTSTRISAPSNPNQDYNLDQCGYGSVRVIGSYTKIVLTLDIDYFVPQATVDGLDADALRDELEDWSAVTWSIFPGGLPETGSNPTVLVAALMVLMAGGFTLSMARRVA
jgi:hypothetical protein